VSYRGDVPTHVYNFYFDGNKKKFIDLTLPKDKLIFSQRNETNKIEILNANIISQPFVFEEPYIGRRGRGRRNRPSGGGNKAVQAGKKIALAAPRAAFLGLILLNVRGLATKFSKLSPAKRDSFWKRFGGKPNKFAEAVTKGAKKKRILGSDYFDQPQIGVAIETVIATATPIIIAALKALKDAGVNPDDVGAGLDLQNQLDAGFEASDSEEQGAGVPQTSKNSASAASAASSKQTTSSKNKSTKTGTGSIEFSPTIVAVAAVGLLATYFIVTNN